MSAANNAGAPGDALLAALNGEHRGERLDASREVGRMIRAGALARTASSEVNNHVHTIYSFSPYAPTMAAWKAWEAGLLAVGIMDHDSVAGCTEMLEAGTNIGIATTVGFELRVNMSGTAVEGRKLNSPDSKNVAYIAVHGIPRWGLQRAAAFLETVQNVRNERTRAITGALNAVIARWDIEPLEFELDVLGVSRAAEGGSITERHLMYGLARRLIGMHGRGKDLVRFLSEQMGLEIPTKVAAYLEDEANPHYLYDLLGVLKSDLLPRVYIQPTEEECVPVRDALSLAREVSAIAAYAYLGDVTESPTGDKKPEKFEDAYLDELIPVLRRLGFDAVTYMPPRNTREQLLRLQGLCETAGLMQISGVDINSSRQSFHCPETLLPEFSHLADSAWALIAHEKLAGHDGRLGLFSPDNPLAAMDPRDRLAVYAGFGREADHSSPGSIVEIAGKSPAFANVL